MAHDLSNQTFYLLQLKTKCPFNILVFILWGISSKSHHIKPDPSTCSLLAHSPLSPFLPSSQPQTTPCENHLRSRALHPPLPETCCKTCPMYTSSLFFYWPVPPILPILSTFLPLTSLAISSTSSSAFIMMPSMWVELKIVCPLEWKGHRSSSNNPTIYPFWSLSIPDPTNSPIIPVGLYVYFITYLLIPITSPAATLNLLTNSFYPLDSVLALISDNFPPSIPLATPWWHLS